MPTDARALPAREGTDTAPRRPAELGGLRRAVLRAGAVLGWRIPEVCAFAEALTGCPWPRCGPAELRVVLVEYRDLARAVAARLARRAGRPGRGGRRATRA